MVVCGGGIAAVEGLLRLRRLLGSSVEIDLMADTAASAIAQLAGADVDIKPFHPVIQGKLLSGGTPVYISARLIGPRGFESQVHDTPPWPEDQKVIAEELGPYLAEVDAQG